MLKTRKKDNFLVFLLFFSKLKGNYKFILYMTSRREKIMKKINVIKQRDLRDCGPCCILSILQFYDGYVPIEKIRLDSYTSNSGTTAFHLINSLKKYGFDAYGIELQKENLNKDLILPAIAHITLKNRMNHYVVIYKILKKHLIIMDPMKGIVKISKNDFYELWNNIIILCHPKNTIANYNKLKLNQFILFLIKSNKEIFFKTFIAGILVIIFSILNGLYFKLSMNNVNDSRTFKLCTCLFIFIIFSKTLFSFIENYMKNYLMKNININIYRIFFEKLFKLPSNIVKNRTTGEIITRVQELDNLYEIISDVLINVTIDSIFAIITFIILYFISKTLLFILLIFIIIYVLICFLSNKRVYSLIRQTIDTSTEYNEKIIEYINAFESIKNNSIENYIISKSKSASIKNLKSNFAVTYLINLLNTSKNLIIDLMYFFIITFGLIQIKNGNLTIINFVTFQTILVYLIDPIKNILNIIPKYDYLKASLIRILEFLENKEEILDNSISTTFDNIKIIDLEYSYNDYKKIFSNINIFIKPNEHIMLKGKSGCGKSTLCKILNKEILNHKGQIYLNDINIKDFNIATIRNNILCVSQNEYLFDDTIKNNIILNKKLDLKKLEFISKLCFVDLIVDSKPLRYETYVNKNFANLSGGEKQRILLARALYQDFNILILDESLSEVNINMEKMIINNIRKYYKSKIIVYITHKNLENMFDRVIDLEDKNE